VTRLQKYNLKGRTITLKIKYHNFKQITRNQSYSHPVNDKETILTTVKELLLKTDPEKFRIRLLGISLSNFGEAKEREIKRNNGQLKLF
jgi:DNA polymerase-4